MRVWDGYLFSAATANDSCSYCDKTLNESSSLKITGTDTDRQICPDCFIGFLDYVFITAVKEKKKDSVS